MAMQLKPQQLRGHLQQPLQPLYLLYGEDSLQNIEAADGLRTAAREQGYSERQVLVVTTGFRWEELFQAASNMSLFGGRTLIDLRIPSGKPGREGAAALQRYSQSLPVDTMTIISLPQMDWRAKKAAWFTALQRQAVAIECISPPLASLPQWIAARLQAQQQSAPPDALEFIAMHVEGNLLAAHQEIQKLGLLYPEGELSAPQVTSAVLNVARYDIDDLRQALQAGDSARCARTLEGLRAEDAAPPLVLWILAQEARNRAGRVGRAALLHAARIDRIIKGVGSGDLWDEFLQLALRLTRLSA